MYKISFNQRVAIKCWLLLSICCLATTSFASTHLLFQKPQQNITGTVTDTNGTLPGVTILIKGKVSGTLTDENGRFSINANQSDVLVFSYLGYKTVEVTITNQTVININLEEDTTQLKEIVLNAGYYSVKDKERTGSISHITAKDIETQPVTNVLATMQGRMSGVNITQSTGVPGGGFNIQIRGINSLRTDGNEPLYIVDGVPFSPQSLGNTQVSSSILTNAFSPLNSINPADIESIEVLKDADATAIYGSRGANGVVLITTKKGKEGKTKFSIHNYTGVGKITKHMKMMNTQQYLSMRQEAYQNDGIITYPVNAHDVNGTWSQNRYTDWHEELIGGTAYFSNLQATLSGGSSSTQYLLSGTYRKETTVFPSDDQFDKIAVHSNVNHKSNNNKFNLNLSVNYASDKNTVLANDLTQQAYRLAPNAPALYNSNGDLNWENGTFDNPLANSLSQYKNLTKNLIANAVITYSLLPTLELKTNLGYNSINMMEFRTIPSTIYNPAFGLTSANSILIANNGNRNSWTIEPQIKWSKEWSSHKIDALAGTTFQSQYSNRLTQMGRGFSSNNLINSLGAANTVQVTADEQLQYKYQALFGRINYTLKDKYIMNLTGRRDGSSRFGPNKRFANFGAIGAAWIFSNEELFNRLKILSFGKLRASYGSSGSDQIGDYQFLDTYSISQNTYNGVTGLQPTRLFNPDFGWEINKKLELAAELGFFKDRILLTSVWYKNRSSNQLVGIPLPATTGFPNIQANLNATIQNTGTEFELRTVNISNNNLSWHTTLNLTIPKNKLLKFEGLEGSSYANTYVVGQSVRIVKQYNYLGIDPENGTYTFQDYNNDGQISATSDRQYISDLSQKWFGGLGNQINFKQWSLDFLFQFVKQDGRNYLYSMGLAGARTNMPLEALNHWPVNGAESEIQSYTTGVNTNALNAYYRYRDSNATITDASFVRLKHLSLSYAIPSSWFQNISGTLYLQGQNLLTFTNYKGADPENQSFSFLPPLCQYTLGLQLNF